MFGRVLRANGSLAEGQRFKWVLGLTHFFVGHFFSGLETKPDRLKPVLLGQWNFLLRADRMARCECACFFRAAGGHRGQCGSAGGAIGWSAR